MLSGSTLLRVVVLFVVAAALAGVVQALWPHGGDDPASAPQVQRTEPARTDPSKLSSARSASRTEPSSEPTSPARDNGVAPQPAAPQVAPSAQPVLPPSPIRPLSRPGAPAAGAEAQANAGPGAAPSSGPTPLPAAPLPTAPLPAAPLAESPPLNPFQGEAATAREARNAGVAAADSAGPRAVSVVDLNTASLAELNALKGGGLIGRAIVQRRPYTSVDQLLSKRVLSRSTYDRIKDQVTVQ